MSKLIKQKYIIGTLVYLLVAGISISGYVLIQKHHTKNITLPANIQSQVDFTPLVPQKSSNNFTVDTNSFKYDFNNKLLTFTGITFNSPVTVTEQAYPETIVFDKFVNALGVYDEVDASVGKVSLTKPPAANGNQVAVFSYNNKVLVFVQAQHDLTKEQWQQLLNVL